GTSAEEPSAPAAVVGTAVAPAPSSPLPPPLQAAAVRATATVAAARCVCRGRAMSPPGQVLPLCGAALDSACAPIRSLRSLISVQQGIGVEAVGRGDAGQHEEVPAAHGLHEALELLAVQAGLHGDEAGVEVALVADEQEALVGVAVGVEAARVRQRPAQ